MLAGLGHVPGDYDGSGGQGRDAVGDLPGQPASLLGVSHTEDEETTVDAICVHLANLSHHETAAPKD